MAFSIESKTENGFNVIVLSEDATQTSVEIIPDCGAILHAFKVVNNNQIINVVEQYINEEDFKLNVESKGFKSCKLSPFVCRVKNAGYNFGNKTYHLNKFLLDDNALHGLLYDAVFLVTSQHSDAESCSVVLTHHYCGTAEGYPFYYDCVVTYLLQTSNKLTISTQIINKDKGLIPIQDGWHPYFTFGCPIDELQLEFQSIAQIVFDDAMIPTGETIPNRQFGGLTRIGDISFDDCFIVNFAECQPACVLRDAVNKIQLSIEPEESYPYLQLYTPLHRNSIAIENLSGIPDAFNNGIGLITLPPLACKTFTTTYKLTLLK